MRSFTRPYLCSRSYAEKWSTGFPFKYEQLTRQRRGRYWKQIIDVPENERATARYQYAEYNNGYELGLRETCQDAEWYIGWLVGNTWSPNVPNGFLLGYIHGKHFRTEGCICAAEKPHRRHVQEELSAGQFVKLGSFAECKPAPVSAIKPHGKRHKKVTMRDVICEALLALL